MLSLATTWSSWWSFLGARAPRVRFLFIIYIYMYVCVMNTHTFGAVYKLMLTENEHQKDVAI